MAQEISCRFTMIVRKDALTYQRTAVFQPTMGGDKGISPGMIVATPNGTNVDFSTLDFPGGVCFLTNLDPTNFVTYGVWDPTTLEFSPLGEILPRESWPIRLSRFLGAEIGTGSGSGTGTVPGVTTSLRIRGSTANCNVLVEAFDA